MLPEASCHVERVRGCQLKLHVCRVQACGDGVEETLLGVLPELQYSRQDGVPRRRVPLILPPVARSTWAQYRYCYPCLVP